MWFQFLSYLKFLWYSKNEHAVHSPFVFGLLTIGLYPKALKKYSPLEKIFLYFNPKHIFLLRDNNNNLKEKIQNLLPNSIINTTIDNEKPPSFDLIYIDATQEMESKELEVVLSKTHNQTVLIIDGIYTNKLSLEQWKWLKKHPKTRVSIDGFQLGLIFFRTEQVKQDFVLRL